MHYKVFLDTNIYDGANYSFRNSLFSQLKDYAKSGNLELQINSVVKGEVQKHIKKNIKNAVKELNKVLSSHDLALFRKLPEYDDRMITMSPNDWVNSALAEFDALLQDCHVEVISSNNIDVEKLLSDYFEMNYPFEQGKKEEFPDAITIQGIASEIARLSKDDFFLDYDNDDLLYCIVSGDKGFNEAAKTTVGSRINEDVKYFDSLNELIGFFAAQDEKITELQEMINDGYLKDFIETLISDGLDSVNYNVNDPEGCVEDVYNNGTGDYMYDAYVIGLMSMSDGTKYVRLYLDVSFDVMLDYSYLNEDQSYWDKETKEYWWEVITDVRADFRTSASLLVSFSIDKDGNAEIQDYNELPTLLEVGTNDIIEVLSKENRDRRP